MGDGTQRNELELLIEFHCSSMAEHVPLISITPPFSYANYAHSFIILTHYDQRSRTAKPGVAPERKERLFHSLLRKGAALQERAPAHR